MIPLGYFVLGDGFVQGLAYFGDCGVLGYLVYCFGGLSLFVFSACFLFETGLLAVKLLFMYMFFLTKCMYDFAYWSFYSGYGGFGFVNL